MKSKKSGIHILSLFMALVSFRGSVLHAETNIAQVIEPAPLISTSIPTWIQGIADMMHSARTENAEWGRAFLSATGEKFNQAKWASFGRGDAFKVIPDFQELRKLMDSFSVPKVKNVRGCLLHTHVQMVQKLYAKMSKEELENLGLSGVETLVENGLSSSPPGYGDVMIEVGIENYLRENGSKAKVEETMGVIDSYGIWYFQSYRSPQDRKVLLDEISATAEEQEEFEKSSNPVNFGRTPFVLEINKLKQIPKNIQELSTFRRLMLGYAMAGAKVRFVPFNEIKNEQPCAGVDIKKSLQL